jgi:hypothetical protein
LVFLGVILVAILVVQAAVNFVIILIDNRGLLSR